MADLKSVTDQIRKTNTKLNSISSDIKDEKGFLKNILGALGNLVAISSGSPNLNASNALRATPPSATLNGTDTIVTKLEELIDITKDGFDKIKNLSGGPGVISRLGQRIRGFVSSPLQSIRNTAMAPVNAVRGAIMAPVNAVRQSFATARSTVQTVGGAIGAIGSGIGATARGVRNLFSRGGSAAAGGVDNSKLERLVTLSEESLEVQKEIRSDIGSIKDAITDFIDFQKQSRLDSLENKLESEGDTSGRGLLGAAAAGGAGSGGVPSEGEGGEGGGLFGWIKDQLGGILTAAGGALGLNRLRSAVSNRRTPPSPGGAPRSGGTPPSPGGAPRSGGTPPSPGGAPRSGGILNRLRNFRGGGRIGNLIRLGTGLLPAAATGTSSATPRANPNSVSSPRAPSAAAVPNQPTPSTPGSTTQTGSSRNPLSRVMRGARRVPVIGPVIGALMMGQAISERSNAETEEEIQAANENIAGTGGALAGAALGGGLGALAGSVVPGVGTFLGGVIGGVAGGILGEEGTRAAYDWISSKMSGGESEDVPTRDVEPRPEVTGSGRNRRNSLQRQRQWDELYGETHNHDGSLKVAASPDSAAATEPRRMTRYERIRAQVDRRRDREPVSAEQAAENRALMEGNPVTEISRPEGSRVSDILSQVQSTNNALMEEERRAASTTGGSSPSIFSAPTTNITNSTVITPSGIPSTRDPFRPE